jgi:hypothetical protein
MLTYLRIVTEPVTTVTRQQRTLSRITTHADSQVDTLHIEATKLYAATEEAATDSLGHGRDNVLNVTVAERLVLDIRVRRDVA